MDSQLNVAAHYDVCNEMFESFLSADMTYSCPVWESAAIDDGESLESAQMRKLRHIIGAANIQSSDHVLETGTGWGSFAIEAVRECNCSVTSITLSKDQKATAEQRIATEGFSSKINVLFVDYRELPVPRVLYDKIVSIEMVEHVGPQFLETYFGIVDRLLNAENGIAVFQSSTQNLYIEERQLPRGLSPSTSFQEGIFRPQAILSKRSTKALRADYTWVVWSISDRTTLADCDAGEKTSSPILTVSFGPRCSERVLV